MICCYVICHAVVGKEKCAHTRKMMFLVWAQWGALGHDFTNVYQQIFAWYHEFVRRRRTFWRIKPCRFYLIYMFLREESTPRNHFFGNLCVSFCISFSSFANFRSTFLMSSAGGRFSGLIPRWFSIPRTLRLF